MIPNMKTKIRFTLMSALLIGLTGCSEKTFPQATEIRETSFFALL